MGFWDAEVIEKAEESKGGFEALPEGNYRVMLVDSEIKETKSGGHYLNAKMELTGNPQYDGRVLFAKFNFDNSNTTAVGIALGQLKELAIAAGKPQWYDKLKAAEDRDEAFTTIGNIFDTLGNIAVEAKVVVQKSDKYGDSNDIKRFKAVTGAAPVAAPAAKSAGKRPF